MAFKVQDHSILLFIVLSLVVQSLVGSVAVAVCDRRQIEAGVGQCGAFFRIANSALSAAATVLVLRALLVQKMI